MKILVLFQVGSIDIGCQILEYIHDFIPSYNIFFLCTVLDDLKPKVYELTNLFEKYNIRHQISFHSNKGMDIGPYLLQLRYVFSNYSLESFDQIFKIHTKTDPKWRNEMLDQIFQPSSYEKWLLPLDKLNVEHINLLCDKFNIPNIYYDEIKPVDYSTISQTDISTNFYSKYYGIELVDCSALNNLLGYDYNLSHLFSHCLENKSIPNSSYIIKSRRNPNIKFYAGSIFKISYSATWKFFSQIDILGIYNLLEPGYTTNEKSTYVHSMERIISGFVYNI
jgi:hypothetical protein